MIFFFFLGASMMLAELALEAGLPNGVLNIVHGTNVRSALNILVLLHSFCWTLKYFTPNWQCCWQRDALRALLILESTEGTKHDGHQIGWSYLRRCYLCFLDDSVFIWYCAEKIYLNCIDLYWFITIVCFLVLNVNL